MAFDLIFSSKLAKLQRSGDQNVPHDFTINFPTPIYLDSEKYQAALKNISKNRKSLENFDFPKWNV